MWKFYLCLIVCLCLSACTKAATPLSNTTETPTFTQEQIEKTSSSEVPLPRPEDTINSFFALINEKRIPEAISMMSLSILPDEATKQAWAVQFNDLDSVEIVEIKPVLLDEATNLYQVSLNVKVNPRAATASIPNYGWGDSTDVRFVKVIKNDQGQWQIDSLATGP